MSTEISRKIGEQEKHGKLRPYLPTSRYLPRRRVYLAGPAQTDFDNNNSAVNKVCSQGEIAAALTRWTLGEKIYSAFLKRLDPPPSEIWEIRVTAPKGKVRLLGRFAEPDTLILTKFHTRSHLGSYGSEAWQKAGKNCAHTWKSLFGNLGPFSATSVDKYVTEKCDDFEI
jgi:hypothetical protein